MRRGTAMRIATITLGVTLSLVSVARAQTLYVPVGGRAVPLGAGRVLCPDTAPGPFVADPAGAAIRPPDADTAVGQSVVLHYATDVASCNTSTTTLTAVVVAPRPQIDPASVTMDVDGGRVSVRGRHLRGTTLHWASGERSGDDACQAPDVSGPVETCVFAIARDLPADAQGVVLSFLPAGVRSLDAATLYDATGRAIAPTDLQLRPASVTVTRLLAADAAVDLSTGTGRVALVHPEAVTDVDCADAVCDLEGTSLIVRSEHGGDDALDVQMHLRPHVALARNGGIEPSPLLHVPLARCPVTVASAAPLRGVASQRIVVRIGGACARDEDVDVQTTAGIAPVESGELVGGDRWLVVDVARVDGSALTVAVRRQGTVLGSATIATRSVPPLAIRLELEGHGSIQFIPTNRDARVLAPALEGAEFVPIAVDGAYVVHHDAATGADLVRGVDGAAGSVGLRFAYRDPTLPAGMRDLVLAELVEPVDRAIREASLPIALGVSAESQSPVVELRCGDGHAHVTRLSPGVTSAIPFSARDTCRLVLHRELLRAQDGAQALEISIDVVRSDGSEQRDRSREQHVVLRPAPDPLLVYVSGVHDPFDRILVRVSLDDDESRYVTTPAEHLGATEAQWTVVCGTDHVRLLASAAFPTGLYRASLSDSSTNSVLALNAGAILRLVLLSTDGQEFPLGLEAGIMWLGVANDMTRPLGEIAIVAGLGVGVPIANPSRASQTSIALHAWVEYEVSRDLRGAGAAWSIVFGPSLSIGDVGASF